MQQAGSGIWWTIHTQALCSVTEQEQVQYCHLLLSIIETLPCNQCKEHALDYVTQNPLQDHIMKADGEVRPEYSMFRYTVDFHNNVNARTGKPHIALITAYQHYLQKMPRGKYEAVPYTEEAQAQKVVRSVAPIRRPGQSTIRQSEKQSEEVKVDAQRTNQNGNYSTNNGYSVRDRYTRASTSRVTRGANTTTDASSSRSSYTLIGNGYLPRDRNTTVTGMNMHMK